MQVDVLEGEYKGVSFQVDYGKRALRTDNFRFAAGDQVYVIINKTPNNSILITGRLSQHSNARHSWSAI